MLSRKMEYNLMRVVCSNKYRLMKALTDNDSDFALQTDKNLNDSKSKYMQFKKNTYLAWAHINGSEPGFICYAVNCKRYMEE